MDQLCSQHLVHQQLLLFRHRRMEYQPYRLVSQLSYVLCLVLGVRLVHHLVLDCYNLMQHFHRLELERQLLELI